MDFPLYAAVIACIISLIYTCTHWRSKVKDDGRDFEKIIKDIRQMNTYNSYFLAATLIFFGFVINSGVETIPRSSIGLLLFGFVFASASIFFIPLKKTADTNKLWGSKGLWLYTLVLSHFTIISTVCGVVSIGINWI